MTQSRPFLVGRKSIVSAALAAILLAAGLRSGAEAYILEGKSWPQPATVTFQVQLGSLTRTLQDGSSSWATAVAPAFTRWTNAAQNITLVAVVNPSTAVAQNDGVNSIVFASTIFGQTFGQGTLAVTYYSNMGSNFVEADILFNRAQTFDSYRGPLQYGSNGYAIPDIRRVLTHELGHAIGLDHPDSHGQQVDAIMNSIISNRETLSADDISGAQSIYGVPGPTPTPPPSDSRLANISTRMKVGTNDNVLIGGFIIEGNQSKKVILRAIGPSLAAYGIAGVLANPTLELRNSAGTLLQSNDNWGQSPNAGEIASAGFAPSNSLESAIVATLSPGSYTAIVRGVNGTTGVSLVEGYDMTSGATKLSNISTRGLVGTGDAALIGGFIIQGTSAKEVMMRALGPSLGASGVSGTLSNPTLELRNSSGNLVYSNDDWSTGSQVAAIAASGIAPSDSRESAIIATLSPGSYTAIVRGVNNTTGVGLVELYDMN